jgi:hypothetical protein
MAFLKFVQGRADEDRRDTLKSAFENRAEKRMAGPICQGGGWIGLRMRKKSCPGLVQRHRGNAFL